MIIHIKTTYQPISILLRWDIFLLLNYGDMDEMGVPAGI
jgi:hypothetical protein